MTTPIAGPSGASSTTGAMQLVEVRERVEEIVTPAPKPASGEPDVARRVVVKAIGRVGVDLYAERFGEPHIADPAAIRAWIDKAAGRRSGLKFSTSFLESEWFEIIDPWLVESAEDYGKVSRLGRKTRLGANQREALWPIFREVREALAVEGAVTGAEMFLRLAGDIRSGARRYDFAVVDEAQDLSVVEARFLAALAGDRPNALSSRATSASASSRPPSRGRRSGSTFAGASSRCGSTTAPPTKSVAKPIACCPARSPTSTATRRAEMGRSPC